MAMVLAVPIADARPSGPTPGYSAIQRAFLQEEFQQTALLAQPFLDENPRAPETPQVAIDRKSTRLNSSH